LLFSISGFYDYKTNPPNSPNIKYIQVSCSERHCCALDDKGYPHCWGERHADHIDPPKITYKEYLQSKDNSGWLIRTEKDEYEDEAEESLTEDENQVSYVQFRQIAVGESFSCGITLLGSHLYCWGDHRDFYYQPNIPKQVKGPFRQVSVGSSGVCAIRAEAEDEGTTESELEVDSVGATEAHIPDTLQCWGRAKSIINHSHFDAWDQVSVGSSYVCGVSMDSQIECGGYIPGNDHKDIIIA
jgi:hypothetical protein